MPTLHAIVAMSENRVIAREGHIPWKLPEDFRWFKYKTMGAILIMGRKTREAIGRELPGRTNLVLSRRGNLPDSKCYENLEDLLAEVPAQATAWVVGGAEIYQLLLAQCYFIYLTRVKQVVEGDTFFPPFEDKFQLDQIIHETDAIRVERWLNQAKREDAPAPESWPSAQL